MKSKSKSKSKAAGPGQPLRVLIVEDSATDAKLLVRELRKWHDELEFERVDDTEAMERLLAS